MSTIIRGKLAEIRDAFIVPIIARVKSAAAVAVGFGMAGTWPRGRCPREASHFFADPGGSPSR